MNYIASGFLKGFMNDQADKIGNRKAAAEDFFNKQLGVAQQKALSYNKEYKGKLDAHTQVAKQLMGAGVPERTVMAIINQNPDDLSQFYETVQKMKMDGVDLSNPDAYDAIFEIDSEFNPGNENVTSLLQKMYNPLVNNAKADPEGFNFDPKGTLWATMLGYNAMGNAYDRLKSTEIMPGVSAYDILSQSDDGELVNRHPLGEASVGLNAFNIGNTVREAKSSQKGERDLTIAQKNGIKSTFDDFVKEEMIKGTRDGAIIDEETASKAAAARTIAMHPEAALLPEVTRWLGADVAADSTSLTVAPEEGAPAPMPPESPSEPRTAPTPSPATPAPVSAGSAPQKLPDGATLLKELDDGTVVYLSPTGQKKRYARTFVDSIMQGQQIMDSDQPDWTRPLGG